MPASEAVARVGRVVRMALRRRSVSHVRFATWEPVKGEVVLELLVVKVDGKLFEDDGSIRAIAFVDGSPSFRREPRRS